MADSSGAQPLHPTGYKFTLHDKHELLHFIYVLNAKLLMHSYGIQALNKFPFVSKYDFNWFLDLSSRLRKKTMRRGKYTTQVSDARLQLIKTQVLTKTKLNPLN